MWKFENKILYTADLIKTNNFEARKNRRYGIVSDIIDIQYS